MPLSAIPSTLRVLPGRPFPLGASPAATGTNFAVWSRHATAMDLCLFHPSDPTHERSRVRLQRGELDVWHGFVDGIKPGMLYGYRAHGPHLPANGLRFNANKLLLDPHAKSITGEPVGRDDMLGTDGPLHGYGLIDNGPTALKAVVIDDAFDWESDALPRLPWADSMFYELHVKGFTKLHPKVPEAKRGTYAGLCEPVVIDYLKTLGVTAVQLLPVHQHLDDGWLVAKGQTNYWGYNTLGFFAPHHEYAQATDPQAQVKEFKSMVKAFHRAGMEVILDVVYNHTAEGDERGATLMLRGLDNLGYYAHGSNEQGLHYLNYTGCGNMVASFEPASLKLILDSLRYWVTEMHVDGFRFDLAVAVGRDRDGFRAESLFFNALRQDPVLAHVKLIAEPWDMGPDGYRVGGFPEPWRELNGKYRDSLRRFWRGDGGMVPEFAKRLCGSDDLYGWRSALATVNMLTSHDGFTLHDVVTYSHKHNDANGEDNRDGDNDNHSINHGVEGETDDVKINAMRERQRRSMMASMFLSLGMPFVTAGDERGRTQRGNNNAYCQDNELSWIDWTATTESKRFITFVSDLAAFRRTHPVFRRTSFFNGQVDPVTNRRDITWLDESGRPMTRDGWYETDRHVIGAVVNGASNTRLLLLFSNRPIATDFTLPAGQWRMMFDTASAEGFLDRPRLCPGRCRVESLAVVCLSSQTTSP